MPTPTEVTTQTLQELLDKKLIRIVDSSTKEDITIEHPLAQTLIKDLANPIYETIKDLNVHRGLDVPDATLPYLGLWAPCPAAEIPMTEEKCKELSQALEAYETE